jgi:hypothetical protein
MRKRLTVRASFLFIVLAGLAGGLSAQTNLNRNPSRVVGQLNLLTDNRNPNLIEGRELYSPQAIAIDSTVSPPILYVSDFANNRVLGWRNALVFSNGAKADFVVGQKDFFSSRAWGPGTPFTSGLRSPTGLAVDKNGNLYVVDTGNNRILRFPKTVSPIGPVSQSRDWPNQSELRDLCPGELRWHFGQNNRRFW